MSRTQTRTWLALGALNGLISVAAGAFGAHALSGGDSVSARDLAVFETAARYQMYHALALCVAAWLASIRATRMTAATGVCFALAIVIFSGSLYALVLSGERWLGAITPVGGVLFLAGWLLAGLSAFSTFARAEAR